MIWVNSPPEDWDELSAEEQLSFARSQGCRSVEEYLYAREAMELEDALRKAIENGYPTFLE